MAQVGASEPLRDENLFLAAALDVLKNVQEDVQEQRRDLLDALHMRPYWVGSRSVRAEATDRTEDEWSVNPEDPLQAWHEDEMDASASKHDVEDASYVFPRLETKYQ